MQIVLLATKFVGDYLGKDGIADEMIRFNGYPYLHANEHAYNIPGELVLPHSITYVSDMGLYLRSVTGDANGHYHHGCQGHEG